MSTPVKIEDAEAWITGLGMALVEAKDAEIARLRLRNEELEKGLGKYACPCVLKCEREPENQDAACSARAILFKVSEVKP